MTKILIGLYSFNGVNKKDFEKFAKAVYEDVKGKIDENDKKDKNSKRA